MHVQHCEYCHSYWVVDFPQAWSCFGTVALQKPGEKKTKLWKKCAHPWGFTLTDDSFCFSTQSIRHELRCILMPLQQSTRDGPIDSLHLLNLNILKFCFVYPSEGTLTGSLLNPTTEWFLLKEIQNYNPYRQLRTHIKEPIKELLKSSFSVRLYWLKQMIRIVK